MRSHREQRSPDAAVTAGVWPGIVDELDYRRVLRILADPGRAVHHRGVEVKHLLSGIATCGVCGAWLRPQRNRGVPSYICGGKGPGSGKGHVCRAEAPLDEFVTRAVVLRLQRPDALTLFTPAVEPERNTALVEELAAAREQLAEYEAVAGTAHGRGGAASFARVVAQLSARIAELETLLAPPPEVPADVAAMAGPDAEQVWWRLPLVARRGVVRALCTVAVLPATVRGRRGFDHTLVRLSWLGP
jgi:site-specific DNA recombinase